MPSFCSPKLILIAFILSAASITQGLKLSKLKDATISSPCSTNSADNTTKLIGLPPFIAVSNSEPNAASKPGSRPLSDRYGGPGED
ncbi:hypothetical protein TWF506_005566 [Arthrobotrys conoides]|uniref:Uncharacterized protein n=1 Tax=Arthrobotrys conoides TaxID=74498 RepID=A0AAN8RW37_9PEZI